MLSHVKWVSCVRPVVKESRRGVDHTPISSAIVKKGKGKGKFHSITGLECSEGGIDV
jgi:hypothetical protein